MDRKEFFRKSLVGGLGCCAWMAWRASSPDGLAAALPQDNAAASPDRREKEFLQHWLEDLLGAMEASLDRPSRVKLMEACGRRCFERHSFKRDIAERGRGNLDKLVEAYKPTFECWREGDLVHIRFGETSPRCYCPAANYRPARPEDVHCDCTRATHQAIFETALGHPVRVELIESLRRGGKTCHFVVRGA